MSSGSEHRRLAIVLSSGALLGSMSVCSLQLLRAPSPLQFAAGAALMTFAIAVLHDGGVKPRTIAIAVGVIPALLGLYLLIAWLSLRNWDGPEW